MHPIISVDTKKRELAGDFKNPGARWDRSPRLVHDHDFRSDTTGIAIQYGIYDLLANRGSVVIGVSHDTPAFAARDPTLAAKGSLRYPRSRQILILSDRRQQRLSLPGMENRTPVQLADLPQISGEITPLRISPCHPEAVRPVLQPFADEVPAAEPY
jgi:hypothetical protein